ncbi:hypothetical protein ACM5Q9_09715 [Advenella sp. RU8]|uniref:hypothetical protein n=1 Tax=Advenella sp. RU8 TaxID=3399575 RepID=UPI003AAABD78
MNKIASSNIHPEHASVPKKDLDFITDEFDSALICTIETLSDIGDFLQDIEDIANQTSEGMQGDAKLAFMKIARFAKICKWHCHSTFDYASNISETFKNDHEPAILAAMRDQA